MQHLATAPEQILVGGILNERVLETVVALRRCALYQQDVGLGEFLQRRLQRRVFHAGHIPQQLIRKAAADDRADLRHFARRPEPVEPRHQRLLKRRRNRLHAALFATLQ